MKKVSDLFDKELRSTAKKSFSPNPGSIHRDSSELFDFLDLIARWHEIVGEKLAKVTVPLKHQSQCLSLLTNHSAYSQQLSMLEETLKAKIFRVFPQLQGKIKRFRFIVSTEHFDGQREDLLKRANAQHSKANLQKAQKHLHPQSPEYKKLKKEAEGEISGLGDDLEGEIKNSLISLYIQQKEKDLLD